MNLDHSHNLNLTDPTLIVEQIADIIDKAELRQISGSASRTTGWKVYEIAHVGATIRLEQDPFGMVDPFSLSDRKLHIGHDLVPLSAESVQHLCRKLERRLIQLVSEGVQAGMVKANAPHQGNGGVVIDATITSDQGQIKASLQQLRHRSYAGFETKKNQADGSYLLEFCWKSSHESRIWLGAGSPESELARELFERLRTLGRNSTLEREVKGIESKGLELVTLLSRAPTAEHLRAAIAEFKLINPPAGAAPEHMIRVKGRYEDLPFDLRIESKHTEMGEICRARLRSTAKGMPQERQLSLELGSDMAQRLREILSSW